MTANGFSSYELFVKKCDFHCILQCFLQLFTKTHFLISPVKNRLQRTLCFDFRTRLLGWGTTFREIKVLSKMATGFVNRATGVGDHFQAAQGGVRKSIFFL